MTIDWEHITWIVHLHKTSFTWEQNEILLGLADITGHFAIRKLLNWPALQKMCKSATNDCKVTLNNELLHEQNAN